MLFGEGIFLGMVSAKSVVPRKKIRVCGSWLWLFLGKTWVTAGTRFRGSLVVEWPHSLEHNAAKHANCHATFVLLQACKTYWGRGELLNLRPKRRAMERRLGRRDAQILTAGRLTVGSALLTITGLYSGCWACVFFKGALGEYVVQSIQALLALEKSITHRNHRTEKQQHTGLCRFWVPPGKEFPAPSLANCHPPPIPTPLQDWWQIPELMYARQ